MAISFLLKSSMLERLADVCPLFNFLMTRIHKTIGQTKLPPKTTSRKSYIVRKRSELSLPSDQPALVRFDRFKAQCTER